VLEDLSLVQLLFSALMLIAAVVFAFVVRSHAHHQQRETSGGGSSPGTSPSHQEGRSLADLEEWLVENKARLREFLVPRHASRDGSSGVKSKSE
jgi:hypothetical protein